ncbi:hypothetical protein [Lentzea flava]|uniref:Excreted virulence factor EspC, type VII ESX diderm n=1 Tax=Lentzea flava TaxID=103732 RepID=A0ABQ2VAA7_9PSEU|nr:hypothetical protein [Lentzea flava]MCP2204349.1 hypothetical protein [Lentzea flava]GGU76769.1 hypothetical protein GCM10010178_79980 [Lentzea flava]
MGNRAKEESGDPIPDPNRMEKYDYAKSNPEEWGGGSPEGLDKVEFPAPGVLTRGFPPPDVPANGQQSGGRVRVSTEALKVFAENLRWWLPALKHAKEQVDSVEIHPGVFFDAWDLRVSKVEGGDKTQTIKQTTSKFLDDAIKAITAVTTETESLAAAYTTAEELNAVTGQKLGEYLENGKVYLGKAVGRATI